MFQGKSIRVTLADAGIAELYFDRQGESVNKLDVPTLEELKAATDAIRSSPAVKGVLVRSAKEVFIVGADIFEFTALFSRPPAEIEAHIGRMNSIFNAFEDLSVPIVTLVNGLALGGGLEMVLSSDARVMCATTQIGLPEVTLGLFPGFGGTVRLPRVTSTATAVDWISTGKSQNAQTALAAGAVDAVVAPDALVAKGREMLAALIASGDHLNRRKLRRGPVTANNADFAQAKESLAKGAVHQPAALAAVRLIERSVALTRDEALKLERAEFAQIARTQAASSLVQLFISDQAIKKKSKEFAKIARKVQRAGVLGAGIMGGGISYISAARGTPVIMKDIAQSALDLGISEAKSLLGKQVESGRMTKEKADAVLGAIRPTLDYSGFDTVDVVVEAVVEKMSVKKPVLAELEKQVKPDAIIASNTSSLSIAEMASVLQRPENFAGMHFFNPAPVMPLVEVIRGPKTSDLAAATVAGYASAMGKTPIVVKECPGFLVNRILTAYLLGFMRALRDGADYLEIDKVLEAFGWPMGPAYLSDVIGIDTLVHVLDVISTGFADRMRVNYTHAAQLMVQQKRLGQKSGVGFYRYGKDARGRPRKEIDPETAKLLASIRSGDAKQFSADELRERLMLPMIIEAVHCVEEGIGASAAEVDMSLILGLGFPRYAGGPLKYADWLGIKHVVERCDAYAPLGPLYAATPGMRSRAAAGQKFY